MGQRAGLLIGATVSLWLGVSLPLAVSELRKLPGGGSILASRLHPHIWDPV